MWVETLRDLLNLPWLEEALIILSIGLTFILTHHSLAAASASASASASSSRWTKPRKLISAASPDEKEKLLHSPRPAAAAAPRAETGPTTSRRPPREAEHRQLAAVSRSTPQTYIEVPGVTDRRFVGQIISYKEEEGYGFISCAELYPHFHRDVFLHKLQIGAFGVGATVSFGVFLNRNAQPQAKDLELPFDAMLLCPSAQLSDPRSGVWNAPAQRTEAMQQQQQRHPLNPRAKPFQTLASPEAEGGTDDVGPSPGRRHHHAQNSEDKAAAAAAAASEQQQQQQQQQQLELPWSAEPGADAATPAPMWLQRSSKLGTAKRWTPKCSGGGTKMMMQWVPKRESIYGQ